MPDEDPVKDSAAILWAEAQRQITRQEADLDGLRTKTVAMLSVASLVAGLFGSGVVHLQHSQLALSGIVYALVLFSLTVAVALRILVPRQEGWVFTENLGGWLDRCPGRWHRPS